MKFIAGIDVSKRELSMHLMDQNGDDVTDCMTVNNDPSGCQELVESIIEATKLTEVTEIWIGLEATNVFWYHAYQFLQESTAFESLQVKLYMLNPRVVRRFRESYNNLPKTDCIDAWLIADCLRFGRIPLNQPTNIEYQALRQITRLRFTIATQLAQEKNRAMNLIYLKFSNYQDAPYSPFGKASTSLLQDYSTEEIATADIEELTEYFSQHSNNRLGGDQPTEAIAKEVRRLANRAYRLHPAMDDAVSTSLSMTLDHINFLQARLKQIKRVISRELRAFPQTLTSIPGMGPIFAAGIIAEIGDIKRLSGEASLANMAGLVWPKHESGDYTAEDSHMGRSGNRYLRYYLVEAANSVRVRADEYRQYYSKKYQEVPKHRHKRALVLTARKLVRLVFALLSKGEIYQARR